MAHSGEHAGLRKRPENNVSFVEPDPRHLKHTGDHGRRPDSPTKDSRNKIHFEHVPCNSAHIKKHDCVTHQLECEEASFEIFPLPTSGYTAGSKKRSGSFSGSSRSSSASRKIGSNNKKAASTSRCPSKIQFEHIPCHSAHTKKHDCVTKLLKCRKAGFDIFPLRSDEIRNVRKKRSEPRTGSGKFHNSGPVKFHSGGSGKLQNNGSGKFQNSGSGKLQNSSGSGKLKNTGSGKFQNSGSGKFQNDASKKESHSSSSRASSKIGHFQHLPCNSANTKKHDCVTRQLKCNFQSYFSPRIRPPTRRSMPDNGMYCPMLPNGQHCKACSGSVSCNTTVKSAGYTSCCGAAPKRSCCRMRSGGHSRRNSRSPSTSNQSASSIRSGNSKASGLTKVSGVEHDTSRSHLDCPDTCVKQMCTPAYCPGKDGAPSTSSQINRTGACNQRGDRYEFSEPNKRVDEALLRPQSTVAEHEYLQFALRITEDIIRNDLYTDEEMKRVFNSHLEANRGRLDSGRMQIQVQILCDELNVMLEDYKCTNMDELQPCDANAPGQTQCVCEGNSGLSLCKCEVKDQSKPCGCSPGEDTETASTSRVPSVNIKRAPSGSSANKVERRANPGSGTKMVSSDKTGAADCECGEPTCNPSACIGFAKQQKVPEQLNSAVVESDADVDDNLTITISDNALAKVSTAAVKGDSLNIPPEKELCCGVYMPSMGNLCPVRKPVCRPPFQRTNGTEYEEQDTEYEGQESEYGEFEMESEDVPRVVPPNSRPTESASDSTAFHVSNSLELNKRRISRHSDIFTYELEALPELETSAVVKEKLRRKLRIINTNIAEKESTKSVPRSDVHRRVTISDNCANITEAIETLFTANRQSCFAPSKSIVSTDVVLYPSFPSRRNESPSIWNQPQQTLLLGDNYNCRPGIRPETITHFYPDVCTQVCSAELLQINPAVTKSSTVYGTASNPHTLAEHSSGETSSTYTSAREPRDSPKLDDSGNKSPDSTSRSVSSVTMTVNTATISQESITPSHLTSISESDSSVRKTPAEEVNDNESPTILDDPTQKAESPVLSNEQGVASVASNQQKRSSTTTLAMESNPPPWDSTSKSNEPVEKKIDYMAQLDVVPDVKITESIQNQETKVRNKAEMLRVAARVSKLDKSFLSDSSESRVASAKRGSRVSHGNLY